MPCSPYRPTCVRRSHRTWSSSHTCSTTSRRSPTTSCTRADLIQILGRWIDVMREVARAANGLEALARVVRYILEVNEHVRSEALQALLEREIGPEAKDTIVTAAQQYIEQGIQQGIQRGESAMLLRLV